MKNYDENKESSFLIYDDANNLYGFAMCKKLPVSDFKWVDDLSLFTEDFIKNYDEENDTEYLFAVDVEYPKNHHKLHSDLPFLPERLKINKCAKLVCNIQDKENYPLHVLALKQTLNHGLKLTKVHSVIEFRQEDWLKLCIDMNTDLRKNVKNDFEKDFFKLMNNSVFGKTLENLNIVIKHDYVTWIQIALLCIFKQKIFSKISLVMLKDGLIHLIMIKKIKDH